MPDHWLKNKGKRLALAWISILWLLLIGWLAFFWNLGSTGLIDETEPLFAESARQMTVTGDWITPFFNGETRFDKPPLIYWLMAIAYSALGVNEWAVRLPSALSASCLVSLGFYTLWSFGVVGAGKPRQPVEGQIISVDSAVQESGVESQPSSKFKRPNLLCAGLGSALMMLNLETIVWARTGVSDMLLTGCMGGALLSFFWGMPSRQNQQYKRVGILLFMY